MKREGKSIIVEGLDAIDGTPILDIKPIMKEFMPREEIVQPKWYGYNETVLEGEWSKMRIYEATIADLDGLASVFNNYRMFYRQDSDLEGAKVFLRNRIERKESVIFVAVEDGEYIGFTQLYPSFSSISMKELWILNDLFVQAAKRGAGTGKNY